MPVHLASNTGGTWLTTFSIAKSRKPIKNLSTGPSLLFFGRKIKAALVGIPALLGMPIFLSRRYAPVFEVEPSNHALPVAPNLLNRDFTPGELNRVWVSDRTSIPTRQGWVYLAGIKDLHSREIVGFSLAERMDTGLALAALIKEVCFTGHLLWD